MGERTVVTRLKSLFNWKKMVANAAAESQQQRLARRQQSRFLAMLPSAQSSQFFILITMTFFTVGGGLALYELMHLKFETREEDQKRLMEHKENASALFQESAKKDVHRELDEMVRKHIPAQDYQNVAVPGKKQTPLQTQQTQQT